MMSFFSLTPPPYLSNFSSIKSEDALTFEVTALFSFTFTRPNFAFIAIFAQFANVNVVFRFNTVLPLSRAR